MTERKNESPPNGALSRRSLITAGAGLAATTLGIPAWAAGEAPIGTWPDGSNGSTVFVGAAYPLTGPYAVQGEDERKGFALAVEHMNSGDPLIKKIAPKISKGVLGKKVQLLVGDSGAKPNEAVQIQQKFITDNKIIAMTGATSSAV